MSKVKFRAIDEKNIARNLAELSAVSSIDMLSHRYSTGGLDASDCDLRFARPNDPILAAEF